MTSGLSAPRFKARLPRLSWSWRPRGPSSFRGSSGEIEKLSVLCTWQAICTGDIMTENHRASEDHRTAAMHHTHAAQYHHESSRHYETGKDYAHAAHQALVAHGHALLGLKYGGAAHGHYAGHHLTDLPKPSDSGPRV